jgi:hypothetical protein
MFSILYLGGRKQVENKNQKYKLILESTFIESA